MISAKMADRGSRTFRSSPRPGRDLYQRAQAKVRAAGLTMNDVFEDWLGSIDESDEPQMPPGSK